MKKYLRIYQKLKEDITKEVYRHNEKLPSKRAMAEKEGVSLITVETAYDILQSEGYIESKERSGYFVTYSTRDIFFYPEKNDFKIEPSPASNDETFPVSVLQRTVRKILSDCGSVLFEKPSPSGITFLKEAIKAYLKRNKSVSVETNQIIIGSGTEYLYGMITELLGNDKIYAIENPSYEQIEKVYLAKNVKIEKLPLSNDGISSFYLNKSNAKILHVTPFRSFPTGVTASVSKKAEYINWAKKRNGFVIEDDYESEFSLNLKTADTIFGNDKSGSVIYLNTFTKSISPAIRVAYMVLPEKLTSLFYEKLGFYSCTVPTLEQFLIAYILNDGSFERHVNKIRRKRRKEAKLKKDG